MTIPCPVCRAHGPAPFLSLKDRAYWRCGVCLATFLDPAQRPGAAEERAHYMHHQNDPGDPRYRAFLSKLAGPLLARLAPGTSGLDFGCGPGPALAAMLREAGCDVSLYDPFFAPDPAPLSRRYDFVTCSEVAEHLHAPADVFDRLGALLNPGGCLGIMTCFQTDDACFAAWWYRLDPTHVTFYREATLRHVAAQRGWTCEIPCKDVALMRVAG